MDNILRNLEDLSRTELVWLNTYLAGRLRALPPENEPQPHPLPKAAPNRMARDSKQDSFFIWGLQLPFFLPERFATFHDAWTHRSGWTAWCYSGSFTWENWRAELLIGLLGAYGRCATRLGDSPPTGNGADPELYPTAATERSLSAFSVGSQSSPGCNAVTEPGVQRASKRVRKASPSVSIFSRDLLCKNTCRYCRCRPCDVGVEHDDGCLVFVFCLLFSPRVRSFELCANSMQSWFFFFHAVHAMTAPTVVQDCILFAHNSKDLTRGGKTNKHKHKPTQTTKLQNKHNQHQPNHNPQKLRSTQVKRWNIAN